MERTALLVIDAQQEYFAPLGKLVLPDGPRAVAQIARALDWARRRGVPVAHVTHESRRPGASVVVPGSPALAVHPAAAPVAGEPVFRKHLASAFTGTGLEAHLRALGVEQVVVSGFMTHLCCDTTAREAAHRGFRVLFLADATATRDLQGPDGTWLPHDLVHRVHLASLHGLLATVTTVEALTGERPGPGAA